MSAFARFERINFPSPFGIIVNMMPIVTGDAASVPAYLRGYLPLIEATGLERGRVSYLTVYESLVLPGQTQRRPGVHTDGTSLAGWGGGSWGGGAPQPAPTEPAPEAPEKPEKGIYMASTDGRCRVWDAVTRDVDEHGAVADASALVDAVEMAPSTLYWMTDRTPHESLPSLERHLRQFFRLVADEVGVWWARHSTANPLGVRPNCRVEYGDKFERRHGLG